ncbi:hypothetical protein B0H16DRAFT_1758949 [Mycena metata]|uniref:Uncharacterized protein n=1 Tax=Mycena metata TaxID=1033252 RepID=A0AAD7IBI1_9AGAR|nr:hypothetical protein B0H16DRAFT_1758949 [Mycena metata]
MAYFSLSTTSFTSRRYPWRSLSDVATSIRPSLGRLRSASAPEPFVSSMAEPSIPSHKFRSPKKSILKRPTSPVYSYEFSSLDSTPDSTPSSSPVPSARTSPVQVDLWSACSPLTSADTDKNESVFAPSPRAKSSLMTLVRDIQIFPLSSPPPPPRRRRRPSRALPNLPPPPEWDEISLTFDSDSDDDHLSEESKVKDDQLSAPITRKVRFVVAAPPPPPPTPELPSRCWDEEPTWSEFMNETESVGSSWITQLGTWNELANSEESEEVQPL